jgi:L-fuculokinase
VKPQVIAVLDVGKTNKKLSVYDRQFKVLASERTTLETKMKDGLEVEASEELLVWFREAITRLAKNFEIKVISVCMHGATCAMLDAEGNLAYPVISYTSEKGTEIQEEFYNTFGDRETLLRTTCTADVGFCNLAKVFYYVKTRLPEVWVKVDSVLLYNSYFGYELTGVKSMEPTYLGNHNYFRDFAKNTWSDVGVMLGANNLFPEKLSNPWDALGVVKPELAEACGLPADCQVTMGLHDSNANFLPYLARGYENFILNSTGTWCVLMSKASSPKLSEEEITAKIFFNLDVFNRPVRTAIFPGGLEYEKFGELSGLKNATDAALVEKIVADQDLFVIPGVMPDASAFPGVEAKVIHKDQTWLYTDLEKQGGTPMASLGQEYLAALNLALALATRQLLERCGGAKGTTVFIEGGFANNRVYCELLATLCPDYTIALTSQAEGTAFGTALTAWMLAEDISLEEIGKDFAIETSAIPARDFGDLDAYWQAFQAKLAK